VLLGRAKNQGELKMTGAVVQNSAALQDARARYGAPPFLRFAGRAECHMAFGPSKWMNVATVTPAQGLP
jgi:hypothetical protein